MSFFGTLEMTHPPVPSPDPASNRPTTATPVQSRRNFELPIDQGSYQTFIDHDSILDDQTYPLYPNRDTVFVRLPGDVVVNFGTIGYTHICKVKFPLQRTWKTTRITCLGVIECDNIECHHRAPPPTGAGKIEDLLSLNPTCPASKCNGNLLHTACYGTKCRIDEHLASGWAILRHYGFHDHAWPDSKKCDPLAKARLAEEIKNNPQAGPLVLRVGRAPAGVGSLNTVVDIHPSLLNADRLGYLRRAILVENGLVPAKVSAGGGDKWLFDVFHWVSLGLLIISCSFTPGMEHFTFQTVWMGTQLTDRDEDNEVYNGGLLTDVTFNVFHAGYLCTTSMFCKTLGRWIPVQLTWTRGLGEPAYRAHFATLFKQFLQPCFTVAERDILVRQVVDFSQAQKEGFIQAYMEVFGEKNRERAIAKLKGCQEHFRMQVTRVKRNRAIIAPDREALFTKLAMELITPCEPGGKTHEERVDEIRRLFPKVKRWLDWWNMADIAAMLFPSRRPRFEDAPDPDDGLPASTNAQESMHRLYYMLCEGKCTLQVGLVQLYAFVRVLEKEYESVLRGIPVDYGSQAKTYRSVAESIGVPRPRKRRQEKNDGRAPDTTEALIGTSRKAGRPRGSVNVDRNHLTTYVSYRASADPTSANRCWLAASLETLFAMFSPLWLRGVKNFKSGIFSIVIKHFEVRMTYEMNGSSQIRSTLSKGQNKICKALEKVSPGSFRPGAFASADLFIELVLDPTRNKSKSSPLETLFMYRASRYLSCQMHPELDESRPDFIIKVTRSRFDAAGVEYDDINSLLTVWSTEGIVSQTNRICRLCRNDQRADREDIEDEDTLQDAIRSSPDIRLLSQAPPEPEPTMLVEHSTIEFDTPPPHLYFHLEVTTITDHQEREDFMGQMDWPAVLVLRDSTYKLTSRGYWHSSHYWSKSVRTVAGISGVWLHDDRQNAGLARLLSPDPAELAGPAPHTSWVFYSRELDSSEKEFVRESIAKIKSDNPKMSGSVPFTELVPGDSARPSTSTPAASRPGRVSTLGLTAEELALDDGPESDENDNHAPQAAVAVRAVVRKKAVGFADTFEFNEKSMKLVLPRAPKPKKITAPRPARSKKTFQVDDLPDIVPEVKQARTKKITVAAPESDDLPDILPELNHPKKRKLSQVDDKGAASPGGAKIVKRKGTSSGTRGARGNRGRGRGPAGRGKI